MLIVKTTTNVNFQMVMFFVLSTKVADTNYQNNCKETSWVVTTVSNDNDSVTVVANEI